MANRFWVGGGSANTWAATANTNWAATSGGANNATVPGVSDLAIFDGNSGVGNSVISANITVQGLDCTGGTGPYAGTITHNSGVTLTINTGAASSIRFSAGMTYTPGAVSSIVTLTHTSGTANITSAGQKFFALTINGAGGTTQLLDALLVNFGSLASLTVTSGIFDANGGAGGPFAITANTLIASGATTRSLILGGTVTIGGNVTAGATIWNTSGTNLTFTKNSANIVVLTPTTAISGVAFTVGALGNTFNTLTLNALSSGTIFNLYGGTAPTFSNLAVGAGWNLFLLNNATTTITNAFTWTGTQTNPIGVFGSVANIGQLATISVGSGACTLAWGVLQGVPGAGGATFIATNTLNLGANTGWAITPPADVSTQLTSVESGTAQAGAAATITLRAAASATDNLYTGNVITIYGGTGAGQSRVITGYVGSTKVASVLRSWVINPDSTSLYKILGIAVPKVDSNLNVGMFNIADSATAATNLSKMAGAAGRGTVTTGATTTSIPTSAFSPSGVDADQFKPQTILFDVDTTTAALRGQEASITASTNAANPTFTVSALTRAPVSGDTFSVV